MHHCLVDAIQNLGREQTDIVPDGLQFIAVLVQPIAMPQHLPDRLVLVGQLLNPVVIHIKP